jgi:hypothetical protein
LLTPPIHPVKLSLPPRSERVVALRALMGDGDPAARQFVLGIRSTARRHFELHVVPRVAAHWPALFDHPFYEKLRIGACDLYASAPYTALFCAPRRPPLVRVVTGLGNALPLPIPALALLGRGAMTALGRLAYAPQHRRIALIAAFIVVVDHVFDHCMSDPPEERETRLLRALRGEDRPTSPELALTVSLARGMAEGLDRDERAAFDAAMDRVYEWIHAEVRAMLGEPDPSGLGHRLAGVEGTIDGLLFPVVRYGGEAARRWMYDVSMFVQIADDWLDYEADLASDRSTPVITGEWTVREVEASWRRSVEGIERLVKDAGLGSPRYVRFVRGAFVSMMRDVLDAMAERPDA